MKRMMITAALAAALATMATTAVTASSHDDGDHHHWKKWREFEGRVLSVDASTQTFELRDRKRGVKQIRVTEDTRFHDGLDGFGDLEPGMRRVEAKVSRDDGAWKAWKVGREDRDRHCGDRHRDHDRHDGDDDDRRDDDD